MFTEMVKIVPLTQLVKHSSKAVRKSNAIVCEVYRWWDAIEENTCPMSNSFMSGNKVWRKVKVD